MTMQDGAGGTMQRLMLDLDGTRLAVTRRGAGPALVCLHAIGHGARDFDRLGERLAAHVSVIALDFPGHGDSPVDGRAPAPAHYADLLGRAADALGLKRFAILGNSIGGATAVRYAAANPERVGALVLCNSGGLQPVGLLARLYCNRMARFFDTGARGDKGFPKRFRRYYERTVLPTPAAAWRREEIIADGTKTAPLLAAAWREFARPEADIRALAPKLACPVLYAWAKDDQAIAWSRSKRAALRAPDHTVKLFDGGHAAFLEQPDAFDAALLAFKDHCLAA